MFRARAAVAALILLCPLATATLAEAGSSWIPAGSTTFSHMDASAVVLPDGDALVIGGLHWTGSTFEQQHVERFDLASGHWTTENSSGEPRRASGAIVLRDGRVLVAGGWNYPEGEVASAELYSPLTDTWTPAEPMNEPRSSVRLIALDDGQVLAVGGGYLRSSELYDPASGHWSAANVGALTGTPRLYPAVAKLGDGRVLAAGGYGIMDEYASAEVYDPATATWKPVAPMHLVRVDALAAGLPDGRVLVAGGHSRATQPPAVDPAAGTYEIYDPAADAWTAPAPLSRRRSGYAQLVTLSDGRLVITGGSNAPTTDEPYGSELDTAVVYDPETGKWAETTHATRARSQHVAVALPDDSVLVAGGTFDERVSERLVVPRPTPTPTPTAAPTPIASATPDAGSPAPWVDPLPPRPKSTLSAPSRLSAHHGVVTVKVRCAGPGICAERLTLRVRGGRTLARTDASVKPGTTRNVRLKLSKADRRRLAKRTTKVVLTLGTTTRNATLRG